MRSHRGPLLLTFGILGIVFCGIFAPIAWTMARGDLADIDAGTMDPEGRSLTHAGWMLGIIGCVLFALQILAILVFAVLALTTAEGSEPFIYSLDGIQQK